LHISLIIFSCLPLLYFQTEQTFKKSNPRVKCRQAETVGCYVDICNHMFTIRFICFCAAPHTHTHTHIANLSRWCLCVGVTNFAIYHC
jgi:hypothetical protein